MASLPSIFDDLTPQWLKDVYLLGVDLTLDDGTPYPDDIYLRNIQAAVALAEHTFHVTIDPITVQNEQHDLFEGDRRGWYAFRLDQRPVLEVTAIRMRYGSANAVNLPVSWVKITSAEHGQINVLPSAIGNEVGSFLFSSGMPLLTMSYATYIPAYFEIDYVAGLAQESGEVTLTGTTPSAVALSRTQPSTDYEAVLSLRDFRPVVTARTGSNFTCQLQVVPPGPITYTWLVPSVGRGSVTFADGNPVTVALPKKLLDFSYSVVFTPPNFGAKLTAKGVSGFSAALASPPAWAAPYTWRTSRVPADLRHWIGMRASMGALNVAGDLIGGVGIASSSIGVDGFSQSINTTSSAENGGFSARIREFERELPPLTAALKGKYRQIQMVVI